MIGKIRNTSNQPIAIYRITSAFAQPAMLHFDLNMCDKGRQMNVLPMVIIPPHGSLKLSTRGTGAMLYPVSRALLKGSKVNIAISYRSHGQQRVVELLIPVRKAPKGLVTRPAVSVS